MMEITSLPASTAGHRCRQDAEYCERAHTIELFSVRTVLQSAALRAGAGSYTFGGIERPHLCYLTGTHSITWRFAVRLDGLPDWDRVVGLQVETIESARRRWREEFEENRDEILRDHYYEMKGDIERDGGY